MDLLILKVYNYEKVYFYNIIEILKYFINLNLLDFNLYYDAKH